MTYRARLADVLSIRDQVLPIWAENLPVRGELSKKLQWFYCDGPHGPGSTFVVEPSQPPTTGVGRTIDMRELSGINTIERALLGARASAGAAGVMGSAGVGARTLWYRGQKLRAALFADLAIDRAHRSGFPALALVQAVKKHVAAELDVGYGFPNLKAAAVYRSAGYGELGVRVRYVRVLRSRSFIEDRMQQLVRDRRPPLGPLSNMLARASGAVVDRSLLLTDRVRRVALRHYSDLMWLGDFDSRFDDLWDASRRLALVLCERSSAFLRWRFLQQPGVTYQIVAIGRRGGTDTSRRLLAYAVIRDVGDSVQLADVFGRSPHDIDALLTRLVPELHARRFRRAYFEALGAPWVAELFALHGFMPRHDVRPVIVVFGDAHHHDRELEDPGSWYLTALDEDA